MSRTTRSVLRTEVLRSAAPAAAVTTLVLGALMVYSEASGWSGRWMPFAASVRNSFLILAPVVVAIGAWQAGRERRRRIREQLAATARPGWQPLVTTWAAVTLGAMAGLLVVIAAGAALVAPVATYAGGGWWWVLAVAIPAIAAMSALGVAVGPAVPFRLTAPVAAIVTYSLLVYAHDDAGRLYGATWLAPILAQFGGGHTRLDWQLSFQQGLWFVGLAATALVVAGTRRRWVALVPAAVAAAGAAPLLGGPPYPHPPPYSFVRLDPAANELVCTDDEPEVCVTRRDAFLLDDVTGPAREFLARFDGVPGGPTRAVSMPAGDGSDDTLMLDLFPQEITLTGTLKVSDRVPVARWRPEFGCDERDDVWRRHHGMLDIAEQWAVGAPQRWGEPDVAEAVEALLAMPEPDQREWMGELIEAARTCDTRKLSELREQLE